MASKLQYVTISEDPIVSKLKRTCIQPNKTFGEIAVGPKGVVLPEVYMKEAEKILDMEVRPEDIWVISLPRTGTTWTEEMTWLLSNDLDYKAAQSKELYKRFWYLELAATLGDKKFSNEFGSVDTISNAKSPRFIKTHLGIDLLPKQLWLVKPKIIYVYRNPKDVVISLYHFMSMLNKMQGTLEEYAEAFLNNKCNYCPFWEHVLDFWKIKDEKNILFLTYEQMTQDLVSVIYKTAKYLGTTITEEQTQKLAQHLDYKNMKKNNSVNQKKQLLKFKVVSQPEDVNFIRKGISGQWKESMSQELIIKFDEWTKKYLLETDFPFYE
ncbi:hypothetical protein PGB90_005029 [Kerria lacca]